MGRPISEVISDILTLRGAIIERKGDCIEFISPKYLSEILNIPEYGVLSFTYNQSIEGAIYATYDSELFRAIEKLFSGKGKIAMATYPSHSPNIERLSKRLSEKITFANATFRLSKVEPQGVTYVLCFLKYVAISDEKREGLFSILINELNLSSFHSGESFMEFMNDLKESDLEMEELGKETIKALQSVFSSSSLFIKEELSPFIKSLERRLNRDIRRVFEYYETLKTETKVAFERKGLLENKTNQEQPKDETIEKRREESIHEKLVAIEAEKRWKIKDLISKYAVRIRIEPICAILIKTETPVFWIEIRRRLSSRLFPLTYNPMFRNTDPLPCEACFYPRGGYYICD